MLIKVTQDHINLGKRSGHLCPVALAIKEAIVDCTDVQAGMGNLWYVACSGQKYRASPPQSVDDFIWGFDVEDRAKPFEFEIEFTLLEEACHQIGKKD